MNLRRTAIKLCALALLTPGTSIADSLSFALIGDQPYNDFFEPATSGLIHHISQQSDVGWILHVGDIKGGNEPCSNELLKRRFAQLQHSEKPLLYVPGDNEWTDCHRASNGAFDPMERLAFLRAQAFSAAESFGRNRFAVRQQSNLGFPEHLMWQQGSTLFISLNVPGSNNDVRNPIAMKQREQAIDAWLSEGEKLFQLADKPPTETVIAIQGNPIDGSGRAKVDGYSGFMHRLVKFIHTSQRPVLLAHGDTHRFQWDKPSLKKYGGTPRTNALFHRVEGWGHPFMNAWVKIKVTPGTESPFQVESVSQTAEVDN